VLRSAARYVLYSIVLCCIVLYRIVLATRLMRTRSTSSWMCGAVVTLLHRVTGIRCKTQASLGGQANRTRCTSSERGGGCTVVAPVCFSVVCLVSQIVRNLSRSHANVIGAHPCRAPRSAASDVTNVAHVCSSVKRPVCPLLSRSPAAMQTFLSTSMRRTT
jgi:hypothetical protein